MSLCAILPVANLLAANTSLNEQGCGPNNFSVPAYAGAAPTHAALHTWGDPAFEAIIKAIPGVVVNESGGDPFARTGALIAAQGAQWGGQAPALPASGNALANTLYRYADTELWWCIQTFNRTTFPAPPATYPALIRRARIPGEVAPWVQPIDQFDAYQLVNAFTGLPDECLHVGKRWRTTINVNVFTPGTLNSGWVEVDAQGNPIPEPEPDAWPLWVQPLGAQDAYPLGAKVAHNGQRWVSAYAANVWEPGVFGWTAQP